MAAPLILKKRNVYEQNQRPSKDGKLPPKHEQRRSRLTLRERRKLVNLAYEVLDPEHTGKILREKIDDIADEIAYLIRSCSSDEQERERQRSLCSHGDEKIKALEEEERVAESHQESVDIHSDSNDDEAPASQNDEDSEDDDSTGFIATEDEIQLEILQSKQLQLTFTSETTPKKRRRLKKQQTSDAIDELD